VKSYLLQKEFAGLSAILFLSLVALLGLGSWTYADDDIPVTCYKDGSKIGTTTTFDWRAAASLCNRIFYDCRGMCVGCFQDNDYMSDVCVDMSGNQFLR
jgi:hypothetical protein